MRDFPGRTSPRTLKLVHREETDILREHMTQVSVERLNQKYDFKCCFPSIRTYLERYRFHDSSHCFVLADDIEALYVNGYAYFTLKLLQDITTAYGLQYCTYDNKSSLTSRILAHCRSLSLPQRNSMLYLFSCRSRTRSRKKKATVLTSRENIDAITEERYAAIRLSNLNRNEDVRQKRMAESNAEIARAVESYPEIRSFPEKRKLIEEWDGLNKTDNFGRNVCAVCGEREIPSSSTFTWIPHAKVKFQLLCNDQIPQALRPPSESYNFEAYEHALLNPKGLKSIGGKDKVMMCQPCRHDLIDRDTPIMPSLAIANWFYYAYDRLPQDIFKDFESASVFERMLVARCSASKIVHRFSDNKNSPVYGQPRVSSQTYSAGNTVVLPQDIVNLNNCLPPPPEVVKDTMCALFVGEQMPTRENIMRLSPVLIRKGRIQRMIEFLTTRNPHYAPDADFKGFSKKNLDELFPSVNSKFSEEDGERDALPCHVDITHLPRSPAIDSTTSADYTDRNDPDAGHSDTTHSEILMENVGYTEGEYSSNNYQKMKAQSVAHCLNGGSFIQSRRLSLIHI